MLNQDDWAAMGQDALIRGADATISRLEFAGWSGYPSFNYMNGAYDLRDAYVIDREGYFQWIGFLIGRLWLIFRLTGDTKYSDAAHRLCTMISPHLINRVHVNADVGFDVYYALCLGALATKSAELRDQAINASRGLLNLFLPEPGVFCQMLPFYATVIDTGAMLLPLMWAKDQDRSLADSARLHHDNILRFGLVRSDFSTWQRLEFAPGSWEPGSPHTIQGFRDTSTWTRGQAWAIHSFTSAYEAYRVEKYLDTALGLVQWFLMKLGNDLVPPYDFDDPDNANGPRDSCTAAIVANALLRLAVLHPPSRAEFRHQASRILAELVTNYLTSGGVLLHGSWGRAKRRFNLGRFPQEDVMPYGNYWIAEALFRWQCEDWAILSLGG